MVEKLESETEKSLIGSIEILRRAMHAESFHRDSEQKYFRFFYWWPGNSLSENDLDPIIFLLSFLDINFNKKDGSTFHFRNKKKKIHVKVKEKGNNFKISAHIDIRPHTDSIHTSFTTRLLSYLSIFLQMINKESYIAFYSLRYSKAIELEELEHEQDEYVNLLINQGELINNSQQEHLAIQDVDTKLISHESLIAERIRKSKESIEKTLRTYQLKKKRIIEQRVLKEIEKREKEQRDAWGRESQHIIEIVFKQETKRLLSQKIFKLDSKVIKDKIKLLLNAFLEELDQGTHGLLRNEFKKVCNNFFPKIFREKEMWLHQERTKTWETVSTQIIEQGFKDISNNLLSKRKFKLDRESIKFKINELVNVYYSHLDEDDRPYFKTCFEAVAKKSFSNEFQQTQELLNAKEEEHRRILQEIKNNIDEFYDEMYYEIRAKALLSKYLYEEETKDFLIKSLNNWFKKKNSSNIDIYKHQFMITLEEKSQDLIGRIVTSLNYGWDDGSEDDD